MPVGDPCITSGGGSIVLGIPPPAKNTTKLKMEKIIKTVFQRSYDVDSLS
jgi:hypothetical protein